MKEVEFVRGRNGIKLPIVTSELDDDDTRDGTYLVRNFFSELWSLNDIHNVTNGNSFNELVIPESSQSPMLIFRSLYFARQQREVERDNIRQSTRPDYDRDRLVTGNHFQSVLTTPESGSLGWTQLLNLTYETTVSASGSTSSWSRSSDSLSAPALERAKNEWRDLSYPEWRIEHKRAVKNLLEQTVSLAL